ncbi:MoaD/ThiS family protein [Leekyejoonella antrihumi]|uniref:assimilatory sulfite reductase (ferredoxin) n=1 Tax=Leekyejoonella antrihumi TaxID=1660198 RepID=A0A563E701_9MICO|nr:MoaD/ThiS family protein [Leekyejoonella antrihumi]TWP37991.1 nitrite/sulfite reductase [Leekyejoonella antrihumi]
MTATTTRTRRSRADRPAPDWELVYKRNYIERMKRDRPPLDVRDELPELIARGYEDIPEEDIVRLYWWALAHDKPKMGTFMVRVKVAGGLVTADQVRALARIARTYGRDEAELTTRQGIQLHWVELAQLPAVMADIEAAGLTTNGGEGDTVRNITGCPVTGLTHDEAFDVTPVIREVAEHFYGNAEFSNLPRKHKYTISACTAQCNAPEISDVALIAVEQGGREGFTLRIGGGMTNTPRISRDIGVFIPRADVIEVLEAVTNAWQRDLRYRISRAKARIKFMMDDYGPEGMRAKIEETLGRPLEDGAAPEPKVDADHLGVHEQGQPGLVYVGVPVPSGRVTGTKLEVLADLAESYGGDVRLTRQQNFILGNVPASRVDEVKAVLRDIGFDLDRGRAFGRSLACTSHRFCNYSVAETKGKLEEMLDELTAHYGAEEIGDLAVHVDGCPHACAQHWVGEIGLQGTTTRVEGSDERVEAYDLTVGGGLGTRSAIGRRLLRRVPTTEINGVMDRLVGSWLDERNRRGDIDFTLGDFCNARTDEHLIAIANNAEVTAARPDTSVAVRVPGPLLSLVGGEDRVEVQAATVGEAVEAVADRFPEFRATVLPGGTVDRAFLVAIGDEDVRGLEGMATPVQPGTDILIIAALSGG